MIITFLYSLAGGMLTVLATARVANIAWKFVRLLGLLALALASLATIWVWRNATTSDSGPVAWIVGCGIVLSIGAMALVLVAPWAKSRPGAIQWISIIAGAAGLIASASLVLHGFQAPLSAKVVILLVAGHTLGALLLGSITLAWLLGHAYLTATKMTIAPLRYFSRALSVAVAARIAFLILALAGAWLMRDPAGASLWSKLGGWWLIVVLRIGVGLVAVAVMSYMVADCVRLRSTQSATGILYFASVMAYVGELASLYLTRELTWPI